ncbi:potassium channel family protein [Longibacter sp.]|uniref:potassium channel family protein n=1 Tax=Longibacter sp. TaxID=2045415 RepID=UPI003EBB1F9E
MPLLRARLQFLLIALVVLIVVYPLIQGMLVLNVMLTAVLFTAVHAVSEQKRQWVVALLLGIPWFIALWLDQLGLDDVAVAVLAPALGALFLGYVTQILLRHVIQADRVDAEMIYGAIAGYLLLGVIWAMLYTVTETLQPGSFTLTATGDTRPWGDLLYYSFVTLTTLGYGDVLPLSSRARSLAVLEAVTGVFYVAVLVARLVSLHILHGKK